MANDRMSAWETIQQVLENTDPSLPKFRRFEAAMRKSISEGILPVGEKFPSEKRVSEIVGVSLGTTQKTMSSLARDGLITRTRGRGTFVTARTVNEEEIYVFRFRDPETGHFIPPLIKLLSITHDVEPGRWSAFLRNRQVSCFERLMRIGDEPPVHSEFYVLRDFGQGLAERAVQELKTMSLHRLLAEELGMPTVRTTHRLQPGLLPDHACAHLMLPTGSAGMIWEVGGFTTGDRPTSYQRIHLPMGHRPVEFEQNI